MAGLFFTSQVVKVEFLMLSNSKIDLSIELVQLAAKNMGHEMKKILEDIYSDEWILPAHRLPLRVVQERIFVQ